MLLVINPVKVQHFASLPPRVGPQESAYLAVNGVALGNLRKLLEDQAILAEIKSDVRSVPIVHRKIHSIRKEILPRIDAFIQELLDYNVSQMFPDVPEWVDSSLKYLLEHDDTKVVLDHTVTDV